MITVKNNHIATPGPESECGTGVGTFRWPQVRAF